MSDYVHEVLDGLVPRFDRERGDWERVVADAGLRERRPARWLSPRRLVLVAVAVAVLATPLFAAASREWWFFRFPEPWFEPITDVSVVKTEAWDGEPWELSAYLSERGLCFAVTPSETGRTGLGGALSCAWVEGLPSAASPPADGPRLAITVLSGFLLGTAYVVGPVIDRADEVEIHLEGGTVVRTPTFDAPDELGAIRFYATQVAEPTFTTDRPPRSTIRKLVGLTSEGEVVACLVTGTDVETDLSACR